MHHHLRDWHRAWHRRHSHDEHAFLTIAFALIRQAIAILAGARRELEMLSHRPVTTGHDLKPTETHLNVPL